MGKEVIKEKLNLFRTLLITVVGGYVSTSIVFYATQEHAIRVYLLLFSGALTLMLIGTILLYSSELDKLREIDERESFEKGTG